MTSSLAKYDAARRALAECVRVDEAKDILDKAAQLAAVAKIAGDTELQANAERIIWRAKDRMGVLLKEMAKSGERQTRGSSNQYAKSQAGTLQLSDLGISKKLSSEAQKVAAMDAKVKEEALASENPDKAMKKNLAKPRAAPKRHAKADLISALDEAGAKLPEIVAKTGVPKDTARRIKERERIRREAELEIDPKTLSPTAQQKLDAAMRQQLRRQDAEFEQRVTDEVRKRTETALPHLKAKQARADAISASYTPRFTKKDCNSVARCLHSDTWQSANVSPELATRLKAAFVMFTKMQRFLCVE